MVVAHSLAAGKTHCENGCDHPLWCWFLSRWNTICWNTNKYFLPEPPLWITQRATPKQFSVPQTSITYVVTNSNPLNQMLHVLLLLAAAATNLVCNRESTTLLLGWCEHKVDGVYFLCCSFLHSKHTFSNMESRKKGSHVSR